MKAVILKVQRYLARRGESLLTSAIKDLDKLTASLEKAEQALVKEIALENADIVATREKLALREAQSAAALQVLEENRQRSRRISDRVSGLIA